MASAARADFLRFYTHFFPTIWRRFLSRVATCDGRFELWQREIVPRYDKEDGTTIMQRKLFFYTDEEVIAFCQTHRPHTLQFGGILMTDRSRDRDRKLMRGGRISGWGEFVLDVDIDDYKDVRARVCACDPNALCNMCWSVFLEPARAVLDYWLRTVMRLEGVLHVFSGRRGFHVWVFDARVIKWSREERTSVTTQVGEWRHHLQDAHGRYIYEHILRPIYDAVPSLNDPTQPATLALVFSLLYPRLDAAVSCDGSHLKKLPFLIHPNTRFVCLPLPPPPTDAESYRFVPSRDCMRPENVPVSMVTDVFLPKAVRVLDACQERAYEPGYIK